MTTQVRQSRESFSKRCPFPSLVGHHKLRRSAVPIVLTKRARWLDGQVAQCRAEGKPFRLYYDELAALAHILEGYEYVDVESDP